MSVRFSLVVLTIYFGLVGIGLADPSPATQPATQPATSPAALAPTDTAGLKSKKGETVVVEGVVDSAEWSSSGKVMNINFKGIERNKGLLCSAFSKNKAKLDATFGGDAAAHLTGAKIQVTGTVELYEGKITNWKDRPEIVIQNPQQIKVLEPAPK